MSTKADPFVHQERHGDPEAKASVALVLALLPLQKFHINKDVQWNWPLQKNNDLALGLNIIVRKSD